MLYPDLYSVHKKIIDQSFCVQERKHYDTVSFIRLYDINGVRICGLIISDRFDGQHIDVTQQGEWYKW